MRWCFFFLNQLVVPLHKSTRLCAHYQLNIIKVVFIARLLAIVYPLEISGLESTQKYNQRSQQRKSLCFNCKKRAQGAAACSDESQGEAERLSPRSCPSCRGGCRAGAAWAAPSPSRRRHPAVQPGPGAGLPEEPGRSAESGRQASSRRESPERAAAAASTLWMRPLKICIYHNKCES